MNNRAGAKFPFDANFSLSSRDHLLTNNHADQAKPFPIVPAEMLYLDGGAMLFLDGGVMEYLGE